MERRLRKDKGRQGSEQKTWLSSAFRYAHFLPGFLVGVLVGSILQLPKRVEGLPAQEPAKEKKKKAELRGGTRRGVKSVPATRTNGPTIAPMEGGELKMVLAVRLDLKMGSGKIASQCAHAAVGTYEECLNRGQKFLLKKWEDCGQPKIVVTCNSHHEMNELRARAERVGLPVYTVADAGRTQVAAGSNTVLAIGPGLPLTPSYHIAGSIFAARRSWTDVCISFCSLCMLPGYHNPTSFVVIKIRDSV